MPEYRTAGNLHRHTDRSGDGNICGWLCWSGRTGVVNGQNRGEDEREQFDNWVSRYDEWRTWEVIKQSYDRYDETYNDWMRKHMATRRTNRGSLKEPGERAS